MKLRLRGNSLRLRLSQTDLRVFLETGAVRETTAFGGDSAVTYALEAVDEEGVRASFEGGTVRVTVPTTEARDWATSERVSITAEQPLTASSARLTVLIEKDFACLKTRSGEDESDAFPNPHDSC